MRTQIHLLNYLLTYLKKHWNLYTVQTPVFQISAPSALCRTLGLHQRLRIPVMMVINRWNSVCIAATQQNPVVNRRPCLAPSYSVLKTDINVSFFTRQFCWLVVFDCCHMHNILHVMNTLVQFPSVSSKSSLQYCYS